MAMNKKEQAELEQAKRDAALAKALRWTDAKPEKDVVIPERGRHTTGWDYYCTSYSGVSGRIYQKWSENGRHGDGDGTERINGSQNGIALYSTKILALKALRAEMELACANELLKIDQQIEKELLK